MFTVIDEHNDRIVLRNYDNPADMKPEDMLSIIVEYNWSLDRKPVIEWCTLDEFLTYDMDLL